MKMNWIPTDFALPAKDGKYIVTKIFGSVNVIDSIIYSSTAREWQTSCDVIAWMPLPEAYKEGLND